MKHVILGTTTLGIMTLCIMTLSITKLRVTLKSCDNQHNCTQHYDCFVMLSATNKPFVLSVVMQSVVMLNAVAPFRTQLA